MTDTPKVRALFERARDLPDADRVAFVLRHAGDDRDLANSVLSLLENLTRKVPPQGSGEPGNRVSLDENSRGDSAVLEAIKHRESSSQRYQHVDEIARGGMGKVSLVRDVDLRRQVAMKVMLDESAAHLPRFIEEAQVMGQLDHPNIVPVHELGIDADGRVFFTMKLVKGETLRDVFEKVANGAEGWNTTRALSVILRVCEAMAFAHSKGVLHRDIKPANIMVGRFGEVYVMDWGLARVLGRRDNNDLRLQPEQDLSIVHTERRDKGGSAPDSPLITMDGTVVGTPAFMPPEQAEGRLDVIGPHSDVYAIGALLYRLLSGHEPYGDDGARLTGKQVLSRVIAGPPRPLHELAKNVPAELLAIHGKAMARRIEDRYPSMTALADDLRAYLEHRVVSAYKTGALAELKMWVQRNPALAAAAGLLVILLAGATTVVTRKNRDLDRKNVEIASQKTEVEAKKAEFDQLAGKVLLERAIDHERDLFPPWPDKIEAMERWLAEDAKRLLDLEPTLERTLADLRARALPTSALDSPGSTSDVATHVERPLEFALESETFLYSTLSELSASIAAFESGAKADVERRLGWAKRIGDITLRHPNARVSWDEARAAILKADDVVASKHYADSPGGSIDLKPQMGLVPIGMNPVTKLWEFYELRSACDVAAGQDPATLEIPVHRADGSIEVNEGTGIVLVLLPGGEFLQGAQRSAWYGANFDPRAELDESWEGAPVSVTLDPFFVSKYETTQGQWLRLSGTNPSYWMSRYPNASGLGHPIDRVSWDDCAFLCGQFGLALPTEARWEYACRAGTSTVFSFGNSDEEMARHGNVRDATFARTMAGADRNSNPCDDFDDGEGIPCRVGRFAGNGFGLFDMHGNVWEWCQDDFGSYATSPRAGDGLRVAKDDSSRVTRGGSYRDRSASARSACRFRGPGTNRNDVLGVRFVRDVMGVGE